MVYDKVAFDEHTIMQFVKNKNSDDCEKRISLRLTLILIERKLCINRYEKFLQAIQSK